MDTAPSAASRDVWPAIPGHVLGLETSGAATGAAVVSAGRVLAEAMIDSRASSQERLLDLVTRTLAESGIDARSIARIGVSIGPGSFTGIRIGLAAARGLAFSLELPLAGVPSHQVLMLPYAAADRPLVCFTGFRRGLVFVEAGVWDGAEFRSWLPAACLPIGEVEARLAAGAPPSNWLFLGEAVESVLEAVPALRARGRGLESPLAASRRAAAVALLAARPSSTTYGGARLEELLPVYLRDADAKRPVSPPRG